MVCYLNVSPSTIDNNINAILLQYSIYIESCTLPFFYIWYAFASILMKLHVFELNNFKRIMATHLENISDKIALRTKNKTVSIQNAIAPFQNFWIAFRKKKKYFYPLFQYVQPEIQHNILQVLTLIGSRCINNHNIIDFVFVFWAHVFFFRTSVYDRISMKIAPVTVKCPKSL